MAITVSVVVSNVAGSSTSKTRLPVPVCKVVNSEAITVTGDHTSTLTAKDGEFWVIAVIGGNIWVRFANPAGNASPGKDWLLADGASREFSATGGCVPSFVAAV